MARETSAARAVRTQEILAALARTYPHAHCELDQSTPLELLIATILSAQCTDKRVNIVTKELFRVCRSAADYVALPQEQLEEIVKTTGFFRAKAKNIRQGDPRDEATDIGPQISRAHFQRVDGFVQRAKAAGMKPALGGGPNATLGGLSYQPTLFTDPTEGSEILRDEVFGPVLCLQSFKGEAQAISMANDTEYGLAAVIMTGDEKQAERVTSQVSAGLVWNNCFFVRDLRQAFGGNGKSGIGREGGTWSFDFYCDVKNSVFAPNGWGNHG